MFKNCSGKGGNLMLEGKSKVNFFMLHVLNSFTTDQIYWDRQECYFGGTLFASTQNNKKSIMGWICPEQFLVANTK